MKILLVDDDRVDRMATKRLLKQSDFDLEITVAVTGYEALSGMQSTEYDLVLLDYNLPDLTGLEVLQHATKSGIGKTAIIFLSGIENEALAQQCLELGAQDFLLKKDINPAHLRKAITHSKLRHANEMQLDKNRLDMQNLAEHDQLTGLLNRYAFEARLTTTKSMRERLSSGLSLMLLDLDNFKWINDTHGHDRGDEVLIEVAKRLQSVCREEDYLCRLGGDEFALAIMCQEDDYSYVVAERIFTAFKRPYEMKNLVVNIECSIGIADFTDEKDILNDVLKKADLAMYRAKSDGRNRFHYFNETLQDIAERRISIAAELRNAIKYDEFVVYYQPQLSADSNTIVGAEALVRWRHPERGILGPQEFLDIAEETGLIEEIDQIVMAKACSQRSAWQKTLIKNTDFKIAINISARHLKSDTFLDNVQKVLAEVNIDPNLIELEIVESELVQDFTKAVNVISQLKAIGVDLAIDDFGTGYSSLSYLKHLNVQTLKVDRSFLSDVPHNVASCRLLKGLINLGKSMELKVVVEGVEDAQQLKKCHEYFGDIVQGYYFSVPLNSEDFAAYYNQYKAVER
ncbi:EAL domain-containing response regulator [Colwellia sp. PAMC 21821]|uniref:two-component system response regulator n=1 Tax=Colwellia sp. PAMC 21821 TaxID=1816219 RepID=UPI0009C0E4AE|nr:EAL domain-containing response regulator [Colwellia sp. PAMC 21821]ARD43683.1 hypothetical protein A3Q33_04805 [Colwellia sp. PAMC 21821]